MSTNTTLKAFRIPSEMAEVLNQLAKKTHRTETYYVNKALENYLEDVVLGQIAKDRFDDPKSKLISAEEMRLKLGL